MITPPSRPTVPFVDLDPVNGAVLADLRRAFERVLASGSFIGGPEVERFEQQLAAMSGTRFAIGVSSGTAALQLALEAAGIGAGDEVILPPNTFFATAEAVLATGATPVFADVDLDTALMDPAAARAAIGPRAAALIAVHLYGQPADMDALRRLAEEKSLFLLEDAAQAIGAGWADRPAGSLGDAAAFSFYPSKNLGALGDAGAVTTSDPELARKVALLRNHGEGVKYIHLLAGYTHRLDALQAAFLSAKLPDLSRNQRLRDRAAWRYRELLGGVPGVRLLAISPQARHVHHLMVVRTYSRKRMLEVLQAEGIQASVHYPVPIHLEPAWNGKGRRGQFRNAEVLADSVLSLPLFPGITDEQIDRCAERVTALSQTTHRISSLPQQAEILESA